MWFIDADVFLTMETRRNWNPLYLLWHHPDHRLCFLLLVGTKDLIPTKWIKITYYHWLYLLPKMAFFHTEPLEYRLLIHI